MAEPRANDLVLEWTHLDDKAVDTARALSMDSIESAGSGHPGTAMSLAPVAYTLYQKIMRYDPADCAWPGRDRFVLSCGHTSMTQYVQLYLAGFGLELDDLRATRTWGSRTPGHPERGVTNGVEITTGPLGSGFASAVGMAMAARRERGMFDPSAATGKSPFDHFIYVLCSDGDLEEGVSSEASSFAGTQRLGNLVVLWDDNRISIEGSTSLAFREDVIARYRAYGWHVQSIDFSEEGGGYRERPDQVFSAVKRAKEEYDRPSLIAVHTVMAWPAPHARNTASAHGAPLGHTEVAATKIAMGFDPGTEFSVADEVLLHTRRALERGAQWHREWSVSMQDWRSREPHRADLYDRLRVKTLPRDFARRLPVFDSRDTPSMATRVASGKTINALATIMPELWGGSADLAESNKIEIAGAQSFLPERDETKSPYGRSIHFGVREFAMGLELNGIALHGPTRPYGATYLVFSDYMRGAVRLAAMQRLPVIFIWTHDSIGVGEDGPTHQPVEQLAALRAIPGIDIVRPADANEVAQAWAVILGRCDRPAGLVLSRQEVPVFDRTTDARVAAAEGTRRGGYVLLDSFDEAGCIVPPEVLLIGTGSEVQLAVAARATLQQQGVPCRVVSMPCVDWFKEQSQEYRDEVLPEDVFARVAVEAGVGDPWYRWVGRLGEVVSLEHFGASAPGPVLFEKFGLTAQAVVVAAKRSRDRTRKLFGGSRGPKTVRAEIRSGDEKYC